MIETSAPGRVNLIGEHTDYNGGFVLPMPIPQRTRVQLTPRADRKVVVTTDAIAGTASYELGHEQRRGAWIDYIQGCTAALATAGHALRGCDLRISSDVPVGAGLSSSAALEIAVLRALREACELTIDDVELALLGQRAENDLVGAPVGAMDQLVVSIGRPGFALFIDMTTLGTTRIALPAADVLVISSGISHDHSTGGYGVRRAECEQAASRLGVKTLRDVEAADLARITLPEPLLRRVRHVVTENARVLAAVAAIERNDLRSLGELMLRSHASLRDDFEVSLPAIDTLVELAMAKPAVYGARLTGGGFGGSIVAIAARGAGGVAAQEIVHAYEATTGRRGTVLLAGEVPCDRS